MFVTCIIAVRNGERFLGAALDSVARQTAPVAEVLVVDDGSSDGSVAVAAGHPVGARILRDEGRGPGAARNLAVRQARGEFLAFLDADDLWRPTKLERQIAVFAQDAGIDVCLAGLQNFADPPIIEDTDWRAPRVDGDDSGYLLSATLARRSLFDRVGGFDEALYPWGEDTDWFLRVAENGGRVHRMDEVLVDRRLHDANLTRDFGNPQRIDTAFTLLTRARARNRANR